MAKFITCEYHGTNEQNNVPVNVDLVQFFEPLDTNKEIYFYFQEDDAVRWKFENKETMRKEYDRILELLTRWE